jgi:hypothetical protein
MSFCQLPQLVLYDISDLIPFPELRHLHQVNRFFLAVIGDYMGEMSYLVSNKGVS